MVQIHSPRLLVFCKMARASARAIFFVGGSCSRCLPFRFTQLFAENVRYGSIFTRRFIQALRTQDFAQSSHESPLTRLNSLALDVTRVSLRRTACPAISRSYAPIGRPADSKAARIAPASFASSSSKGRNETGPDRNACTLARFASLRSLFSAPYHSSKAAIAET